MAVSTAFVLAIFRGTQQTISVNICSRKTYYHLRFSDESVMENWSFKLISSNFRDMGKVMPVVFRKIKMS